MKYELNDKEGRIVDLAYFQTMYADKPVMCWLISDDADLAAWVKDRG